LDVIEEEESKSREEERKSTGTGNGTGRLSAARRKRELNMNDLFLPPSIPVHRVRTVDPQSRAAIDPSGHGCRVSAH